MKLSEQEVELVRQQLAANRMAAIDSKQAYISARMYRDGKSWRVKVFNKGPSDAKNVRLVLDDNNYLVTHDAVEGKFPMDRMEKLQSVDFWAIVNQDSPSKETLTIMWDDLSGSDRKNSVEITV